LAAEIDSPTDFWRPFDRPTETHAG